MAKGGGNKKIFQYSTDPSGQENIFLRALQGHSGSNLIDPSLQDNVVIPNDFFEYIYHIGCAMNLHSIMNSGLIPEGQNLNKRQTVFFTSTDPMNKEHRDSNKIDLEAQRLAWYKQKVENTSRYGVLGRQKTCSTERMLVLSNKIDTLPACCIPKAIQLETGEIKYEKVFASPRPPPRISFTDNWMKELGSEVAVGSEDSKQIQPKSKTQLSSTERLASEQPPGLLTKGIEKDVLFGCESTNSRMGRLVFQLCVSVSVKRSDQDKDADENVDADHVRTERPVESEQPPGLFTQLEETDIDFRVSGLPHAVVKQAENFRVRELVKKIESHPHREPLQADLL